MSWVVVAISTAIVLQGASAWQKYETSEDQANALAREGNQKAEQRAIQARKLAGQQKASFVSSGISITGTEGTAGFILKDTYKTGLEDVNQIKENYNTKSGSVMSMARAQLMSDMSKMAMTASGLGGGGGAAGATPSTASMGQMTGSAGNVNPTSGVFSGASASGIPA